METKTLTISILILFVAVLIFQPSIIYFIWSMFLVVVAFVFAVPISTFFAIKIINHAIRASPALHQNGPQNNVGNNANLLEYFLEKLYKLYMAFLLAIAQSPVVQLLTSNNVDTIKHETEQTKDLLRRFSDDLPKETRMQMVYVSPNVDKLMLQIFDYTYRDYVETWLNDMIPDSGEFRKFLMADFLQTYKNFCDRLSRVDTVHLFMERIVKILNTHFEEIWKASTKANESSEDTPKFKLHPCLRNEETELQLLRRMTDYLLLLILPEKDIKNTSMILILREVLAKLVLLPLINTVCDPNIINQTLVSYLQSRTDAHDTRTYMYAATYEKFVTFINECKDISVLQKIRYQIMTEVMHATNISSLKKEGFKKSGKSRQMAKGDLLISRDLKRYINQCQMAKEHCERRIKILGGANYGSRFQMPASSPGNADSHMQLLTYDEVMLSPMMRSYFMRYLKDIGKAQLLKYWNEVEIIQTSQPSGKNLAQMVGHAYQTYILQGSAEELGISLERNVVKGMEMCVVGEKSPEDFVTVQKLIYKLLKKDYYPSFVVSDTYAYQLMPELVSPDGQTANQPNGQSGDPADNGTRAFGQASSDNLLQRLQSIEGKLEYKAQALETLRPTAKLDTKVTHQLEGDIATLQSEKLRLQLYMERTEFWWSKIGQWTASIAHADIEEVTESCFEPVYTIIVQCSDNSYDVTDDVSGWMIGRTLSEFRDLHKNLKELQPWVKSLSIPKTSFFGLQKASQKFLGESQTLLNQYLDQVLSDSVLSCSEFVFDFLCKNKEVGGDKTSEEEESKFQLGGFIKNIPRDFMEFLKSSEDEPAPSADIDVDDYDDRKDSIATPLYSLISEVFELRGVFRPLRQTLIVFVRLVFGGTINKQIRDTVDWLVSESMIAYYLQFFLDSMWPNGQLASKYKQRSEEEMESTLMEARQKVLENIPEVVASLVGHENARRGCVKIFTVLQNKTLNKHLAYTAFVEIFEEIFPEIIKKPTT